MKLIQISGWLSLVVHLGVRTRLELRFLLLVSVFSSVPWLNHQRIPCLNKLNNLLCPLLLKLSTKKKSIKCGNYLHLALSPCENIWIWAQWHPASDKWRLWDCLPIIRYLLWCLGISCSPLWPSCKAAVVERLLLFHSHRAAFLSIPTGFKPLQQERQCWAPWAKAISVGASQHSHFPTCC